VAKIKASRKRGRNTDWVKENRSFHDKPAKGAQKRILLGNKRLGGRMPTLREWKKRPFLFLNTSEEPWPIVSRISRGQLENYVVLYRETAKGSLNLHREWPCNALWEKEKRYGLGKRKGNQRLGKRIAWRSVRARC